MARAKAKPKTPDPVEPKKEPKTEFNGLLAGVTDLLSVFTASKELKSHCRRIQRAQALISRAQVELLNEANVRKHQGRL